MTEAKNTNGALPPKNARVLIPCLVHPGMFRDEWIVVIDAADRNHPERRIEVQMFADVPEVTQLEGAPARGAPVKGWLRTTFAGTENGLALVVLPQVAPAVGEYLLIEPARVKQETAA